MTECRSPELQDLLPDYVADTLDSVATARVSGHLDVCGACAEDLALLQMVRKARPRVDVPDIARIVAALPTAPADLRPDRTGDQGPRLVRGSETAPPSTQRGRPTGRAFGPSPWRVAATLAVVLAGGASLVMARRGVMDGPAPLERITIASAGESAVSLARPVTDIETLPVGHSSEKTHPVSVSYGDLGDYSEAELERMIARLDEWDGVTNTEPLPGVPILPNGSGGTP